MSARTDPDLACIAVDWSGALHGSRRKIWLAEARGGRVLRLEDGRSRSEVIACLIELARAETRLVVGLDFAFAFPEWFAREHRCRTGRQLWKLVDREGEEWLARRPTPFWGGKGSSKPVTDGAFRRTEQDAPPVRGIQPKSVFQVLGAGTVGTGSIRGMPHLATLQDAGFAIWPFDDAAQRTVVEIYPRYLTRAVDKSAPVGRHVWIANHSHGQERALERLAASNEDAFDAFASALVMSRHAHAFARLEPARDARERLEGRIWRPDVDPHASAS